MAGNTVSLASIKETINFAIDNNIRLQEEGKFPIAIGLEASAGIGKTSVVQQIAKERNMGFVQLNMAEMEEAGDLVGYPMKEYECQMAKRVKGEDGKESIQILPGTIWLNEKQLDAPRNGILYRQTGKTRMSYAKPSWVPEYNENGTILLLDDYNRANTQLLNACMRILREQKYVSWSLPKKTTIVLTNNPDNGEYNVSSQDEAQEGRYINFNVAWDLDAWARWAEEAKIDGRCINFVMSYSNELFNSDGEGNRICNPRSYTMFADMIGGVKDWDKAESLSFINTIAKGCFKDDNGRFAAMFNSYIRNKMHLVIQPKDMLLGAWDTVKERMEKTLFDTDGSYRPDIASLLERRFSNYVLAWLGSADKTPIAKVKDRILDFMNYSGPKGYNFFNKDMYYHMIKTITSEKKQQTNNLLFEPRIAKYIS